MFFFSTLLPSNPATHNLLVEFLAREEEKAGGEQGRQERDGEQGLDGVFPDLNGARRLGLEQGVQEVVLEAQRVVKALQPTVGILLEAEVVELDHAEAMARQHALERTRAEMPVVARHVEVEPMAAEKQIGRASCRERV